MDIPAMIKAFFEGLAVLPLPAQMAVIGATAFFMISEKNILTPMIALWKKTFGKPDVNQ